MPKPIRGRVQSDCDDADNTRGYLLRYGLSVVLPRQAPFRAGVGGAASVRARINWRPFELNPDLPWEGVDRAGYLASKFGDSAQIEANEAALVRHGSAVGLEFRFDLVQRVPNTRRSHLLIAHAARQGLASEVVERIMQAYFEEGCDIGEVDELVRLGVEAGLSERETRSAMVLREGQDGVVAAERHASVLGINGVPTFIFDRQYSVSGAQEIETFTQVIDQVIELAAAREFTP